MPGNQAEDRKEEYREEDEEGRNADPGKVQGSVWTHPGLKTLQSELAVLKVQAEFLALKSEDTKASIKKLKRRIELRQQKIDKLNKLLEISADEITEINGQIEQLHSTLEQGDKMVTATFQRFRGRMRQLHKARQGTVWVGILAAGDLNSFLNRYQMLRYLLEHDRKLLAELKTRSNELEQHKQALDLRQNDLERLSGLQQHQQREVEYDGNALKSMLKTLILEQKHYQQRLQQMDASRQTLEEEIRKAEAKRDKAGKTFDQELVQAGANAKNRNPLRTTKNTQAKPESGQPAKVERNTSEAAIAAELNFDWPVANRSDYRLRFGNASEVHAIEIAIDKPSEIYALAEGKVQFKGPLGRFGNVVILGHRRGFSSVYGNLDEIWVGLHQIVTPGEALGRVIGARNSHLHFEIRFGGKNRDPLAYLPHSR